MENEAFDNDKPGCVDELSSDWVSPPQPDYASPCASPPSFNMTQPTTPGQPQQQVIVVEANPTPDILNVTNAEVQPPVETIKTTGAFVLAGLVLCFGGPFFGPCALKLAKAARKSALAGHTGQAKEQRYSSYFLSIVGIVIGVSLIACIASYHGPRTAVVAAIAVATTIVRPSTAVRTSISAYRRVCYNYSLGIYYYY